MPRAAFGTKARADGLTEKQKRNVRWKCPCWCRCGSSVHESVALCYLCTEGIHHRCSRACGAYPESYENGIKLFYVPERPACRGGTEPGSPLSLEAALGREPF